jgi:hypothetical protein
MTDRDFEIGSIKFKLGKINAIKQFQIARRVAPILSEMLPMLDPIAKSMNDQSLSESEKFGKGVVLAKPVLEGFSKLSDKDSEYVLFTLLSSVEMQQSSGNWAKLANESMILFQDLELSVLMNAAGRAFFHNLTGFFAALPRN